MKRVGTGIKRIQEACYQNNKLVEFNNSDSFFVEIHSNINTSEKIIRLIKIKKGISTKQIAKEIDITQRAVEMQISKLKKKGKIKRVGSPKNRIFRS